MARTELRGGQVKDASIGRSDLITGTAGEAVIAKLVAGFGVTLSGTGADSGTGDVTISAGKWTVLTNADTGAQNNWAPGLSGNTLCIWSGAADAAMTGIAGGVVGQIFAIKNTGTKIVTFAHNSGSSSAGNKCFNFVASSVTPVAPGGYSAWQHDGTQWQIIAHEQGAWITPTFAAGDYTSNAGTWVLSSPDRVTGSYILKGRTLSFIYTLNTTTITGAPTVLLIGNGAWGGFTIASTSTQKMGYANDGAVHPSYVQATATATTFGLNKDSGAAWTANTNASYFQGNIDCEVT